MAQQGERNTRTTGIQASSVQQKKHPPTVVILGKREHRGILNMSCTHLLWSQQIIATDAALPDKKPLPGEGCGDVEAGAISISWSRAGDWKFQEPNASSSTHGKGKHSASFPASKIITAPSFLHLPVQPEPKPQLLEPGRAGGSGCDCVFGGRTWFCICLPKLCQEPEMWHW